MRVGGGRGGGAVFAGEDPDGGVKRRRSWAALIYFDIEFMLGSVEGYMYVLWGELARMCGDTGGRKVESR